MKNFIAVIALLLVFVIPTLADDCTGNTFVIETVDEFVQPVAATVFIQYLDAANNNSSAQVQVRAPATWIQPYCGGVFINAHKTKPPYDGFWSPGFAYYNVTGPLYQPVQFMWIAN